MSKPETNTNDLIADDMDDLTTEEFESALADLLRTADRSNVVTTRSLDVTTGGEHTEWMIEITRVDRRP